LRVGTAGFSGPGCHGAIAKKLFRPAFVIARGNFIARRKCKVYLHASVSDISPARARASGSVYALHSDDDTSAFIAQIFI